MTSELGLCLAAFADRPLEEALIDARGLGLDLVDLPTDSTFRVSPPSAMQPGDQDARDLSGLLKRHGIRVACVSNSRDCQLVLGPHGPHTDQVLRADAREKRAHGEAMAWATIRMAEIVGAPLVRLFLGCPDFGRWLHWSGSGDGWDANIDEFIEAAVPLAKAATEAGTTLCIEPHVKQVPFDARSVRACLAGVEAAGGDIEMCFDPANIAAIHHDPVSFLRAVDRTPACVHAKDVELAASALPPPGPGWVSYGPQPAIRFRSVPWGGLDWRSIFTRLLEMGYEGPIMIEHEDVLVDRIAGIAEAKRTLRSMVLEPGVDERWW